MELTMLQISELFSTFLSSGGRFRYCSKKDRQKDCKDTEENQ